MRRFQKRDHTFKLFIFITTDGFHEPTLVYLLSSPKKVSWLLFHDKIAKCRSHFVGCQRLFISRLFLMFTTYVISWITGGSRLGIPGEGIPPCPCCQCSARSARTGHTAWRYKPGPAVWRWPRAACIAAWWPWSPLGRALLSDH